MSISKAVAAATADSAGGITTGDRRGFLGRLGAAGAGLVGAISITFADSARAEAINSVGCCDLATTKPCGGHWNNDGNFTCPSGHHKTFWACCCGDFIYHCWECSGSSSSCDIPPWSCSNWWNIYLAACCESSCGC